MSRSVSADLELEPGTYSVLMKITSKRWPTDPTPEQIIKQTCKDRPEKLTQVGLAYDLAHAKGQVKETDKEKAQRKEREEKKKAAAKKKEREEVRAARLKQWQLEKKQRAREKRHAKRKEEHERKRSKKRSALPQNAPVTEATAASYVNGDITDDGRSANEATAATTAMPQSTELQSDAPATSAALPQNTQHEDQLKNGITPEIKSTRPNPDVGDSAPSNHEAENSGAIAVAEGKLTNGLPPEDKNPTLKSDVANSATRVNVDKPSEVETPGDALAEPKAEHFHNALQSIPSVHVNGGFITAAVAVAPSTIAGQDDWQYDSDASFDSSIDSDLDFPPEIPLAEPVQDAAAEDDEENAEFADDPWNAVCVVGLRVYSKDPELSVEIIRPRHDEEDGDTPLDVDDASKGASVETVGGAEVKT